MMPMIYLLILVGWLVLIFGFYVKEFAITSIASFYLMTIGVHIATNGLNDINVLITQSIAIVHIAVGAYFVIVGGYEKYKEL